MSVDTDVQAIKEAMQRARTWKSDAISELDAIKTDIEAHTIIKRPNTPEEDYNPDKLPYRTPTQITFLKDYADIKSSIEGLKTKLEDICKAYGDYTDTHAWVKGYRDDEAVWKSMVGPLNQAYTSTELGKLKAYNSWQGNDAQQYKSNAIEQHFAILTGLTAARNLESACKKIADAGETLYKELAAAISPLKTMPPDISDKYSSSNPPDRGTVGNTWWESLTDPGSPEDKIGTVVAASKEATRHAFTTMVPSEFPNRPDERRSVSEGMGMGWPKPKVF